MAGKLSLGFSTNVKLALFGALCFWAPDLLVHLIQKNDFNSLWFVTISCPLAVVVGYVCLIFLSKTEIGSRHTFFMLLGIWCAGGLATMISASFAGGGFASGFLSTAGISLSGFVFPPLTLMLGTYDGSLFALFLVSILLILDAATRTSTRLSSFFHPAIS